MIPRIFAQSFDGNSGEMRIRMAKKLNSTMRDCKFNVLVTNDLLREDNMRDMNREDKQFIHTYETL